MVETRLLTAMMAQGKEKYMKVQEKSNLEKQMLMHTVVLFWKMKNLYKRSSCDLLRSHFFYYAKFFLTFGVENFLPFEYIQSKHLSYGPATSLVLIRVGYKEWVNTIERFRDYCQWPPLSVLWLAVIGKNLATFLQC